MRDKEDCGSTLGDLSEGAFLRCSCASCDGIHPSIVFSKIFASLLALRALFLPQIKAFCTASDLREGQVCLWGWTRSCVSV